MLSPNNTYVYEEAEVKLTGRVATRKSKMDPSKILTLYEIQPADPEAIRFMKWVTEDDLFTISTIHKE